MDDSLITKYSILSKIILNFKLQICTELSGLKVIGKIFSCVYIYIFRILFIKSDPCKNDLLHIFYAILIMLKLFSVDFRK